MSRPDSKLSTMFHEHGSSGSVGLKRTDARPRFIDDRALRL